MGRERRFIKGDTTEEKFDAIERVLQLMSTRMFKTATVVIPPIPLSFAYASVPLDGEVFRGFFNVDGHISRIDVLCEKIEKDAQVSLVVNVLGTVGKSVSFNLKTGLVSFQIELGLPKGSKVLITVDGDRDKVTGLWASALYETHMGSAAVQPLVIDDLLEKAEGVMEDA